MARIALVNASAATAASVRAAAAGHAVTACGDDGIPADADLVIFDLPAGAPAPAAGIATGPPLLLLVEIGDRHQFLRKLVPVPDFSILEKPCDLLDLRLRIRELLEVREGRGGAAGALQPGDSAPEWLSPPFVPASAASALAAAVRLGRTLWLVGEDGTGTDHVAAAIARAWDDGREPIVWAESESIATPAARLDDARRVLWVPALGQRSVRDQHAFERLLALEPARRIVVTSGDDPDSAVTSGLLLRGLHQSLSRMTVRLLPLRERTGEIVPLASKLADRVGAAAFGIDRVPFADDARRLLETYPWPGNLRELDAVVTRSVVARGPDAVRGLGAEHIRFETVLGGDAVSAAFASAVPAPGAMPLAPDRPPVEETASPATNDPPPPARRGVVVPLGNAASARGAKNADAPGAASGTTSGATIGETNRDAASAAAPPTRSTSGEIEAVLAAFAHDIRNPMSTIKTFAGLHATAGGADELARLAADACERVDEHLEFLQRYAELVTGGGGPPSRVDAVETFGEALDAAGSPVAVEIAARGSLWANGDAALLRFVADALVAECTARLGGATSLLEHGGAPAADPLPAVIDVAAGGAALSVRLPVGGAAVDRLGNWLATAALPWRLAIARDVARLAGGDLALEIDGAEMRILWHLPAALKSGASSSAVQRPASAAKAKD